MPELKTYKVNRGGLEYELQATEEHAKEVGLVELKGTSTERATTKPKRAKSATDTRAES